LTVRALAGAAAGPETRAARALARLLEVSAGLSGDASLEPILQAVTDLAFDHVDADRAALLLTHPASGALELSASRNRVGDAPPRVPRVIATRAMEDRAPVLTASAMDDERFRSGSVVLQAVRSAVCVPLLDADGRVLGALYADTITRAEPFNDDEAHALLAFAGLAAVVIGRARYAEEARRAREVRANFERFFAPGVAAAIARSDERVALGGRRVPAAVLFTDLRGFTTLAESLPPEELAALLEDYFAVAVEAVFEQDGTLDKFVGDAVMAVWGAPLPCPDPVDRALAAALAIRRGLAAVNEHRALQQRLPVALGIGIGYGEVFAGNVGSERRLEYTVVGDAVNVAAHLAGAAQAGEILLAAPAVDRLLHKPRLTPIPEIAIKGRTPVQVYRV
jgi:adenylate cyclase